MLASSSAFGMGMETQDLRRNARRALLILTLDGSNVSNEMVLLVKLGNSANFYKIYILGDQLIMVVEWINSG